MFSQLFTSLLLAQLVFSSPIAGNSGPYYNISKVGPFGLLAIASGTDVQYQTAVISHGGLYLSGSASDPYSFQGILYEDGSLKVVEDASRFQSEGLQEKYLTTSNTSQFVIGSWDPSFAIKGGHLTYKGADGAFAVPIANIDGYDNALYQLSSDVNATSIALQARGTNNEVYTDFP